MSDKEVLKYLEQTTTVDIYRNTGEGPQLLTLVSAESVTYCKQIDSDKTLHVVDKKHAEKFCLQRVAGDHNKLNVLVYPNMNIGMIDNETLSLANGSYEEKVIPRLEMPSCNYVCTFDGNQIIVAADKVSCEIRASADVTMKVLLISFGIYCSLTKYELCTTQIEDKLIDKEIRRTFKHIFLRLGNVSVSAIGKFDMNGKHTGFSIVDKENKIILFATYISLGDTEGWLMVQDAEKNEFFRTYLKDQDSTVYDEANIIGKVTYTHIPIRKMTLNVFLPNRLQNRFHGEYLLSGYGCCIRDGNDEQVAQLIMPKDCRVGNLTLLENLSVLDKKVILSQFIKSCIFSFKMNLQTPLVKAVTQPPSTGRIAENAYTFVNYKDVLAHLPIRHDLWPVGFNAKKTIFYYNLSPMAKVDPNVKITPQEETVFTFECALSTDHKDIDIATLKTRYGEEIMYVKKLKESGCYNVCAPNHRLIANIKNFMCYDASSNVLAKLNIVTEKKAYTKKEKLMVFFDREACVEFHISIIVHATRLNAFREGYKRHAFSSENWALGIACTLIYSIYSLDHVNQSFPMLSYNYKKRP